jgi:hypothetical protein
MYNKTRIDLSYIALEASADLWNDKCYIVIVTAQMKM